MPGPAAHRPDPASHRWELQVTTDGFFSGSHDAPAHLTAGSGVERKWQMTKLE